MKFKQIFNTIILTISLGITGYSYLKSQNQLPLNFTPTTKSIDSSPLLIKDSSSIYDGDTLRVIRGNEELKIRLCGIDSPELEQPLGIEARDYLRSLIAKGDGTVYLIRAGEDRYGRTVGELFMPLKSNPEQEIHLNTEMISAGMAWHYKQYSDDCPNQYGFEIAENNAKQDKVGVHEGNHQPPWEFRASAKTNK